MGPISQFDLFSITGPGPRTEENAEQLKFMVGGAEGGSRYGASEQTGEEETQKLEWGTSGNEKKEEESREREPIGLDRRGERRVFDKWAVYLAFTANEAGA